MNGTVERLQLTGMRLRDQQTRMRAGRLDRRNERLRHHVDQLQTELDRERESREELLDLVKREAATTSGRRGGAVKLLIVGGVAYLLGTRAGRERYDQIVSWARRMKATGQDKVEQLRDDAMDVPTRETELPSSASLGVTTRSTPRSAVGDA